MHARSKEYTKYWESISKTILEFSQMTHHGLSFSEPLVFAGVERDFHNKTEVLIVTLDIGAIARSVANRQSASLGLPVPIATVAVWRSSEAFPAVPLERWRATYFAAGAWLLLERALSF
jgi:hypothetical protein